MTYRLPITEGYQVVETAPQTLLASRLSDVHDVAPEIQFSRTTSGGQLESFFLNRPAVLALRNSGALVVLLTTK